MRWGHQGPARVASGMSNLHASCKGPLRIPLQSFLGPRSSSGVEGGTSGFLSSADMDLGVPLQFPHGNQVLSCVETCKSAFSRAGKAVSGFLSSCHRDQWLSLEVPQGCHTCHCVKVDTEGDSRIGPWESVVSGVDWDIGVFCNRGMTPAVPLEVQVETASS